VPGPDRARGRSRVAELDPSTFTLVYDVILGLGTFDVLAPLVKVPTPLDAFGCARQAPVGLSMRGHRGLGTLSKGVGAFGPP
jgi:hypothetical protein